jgi:hypothetical protein
MPKYVVTTNNKPRTLVSLAEVPAGIRSDFDYITGEDVYAPRLVQYRGSWYDVNDTEGLAPDDLRALGWDVYLTDTFFSGIVFRHFDADGEYRYDNVVVGRFFVND